MAYEYTEKILDLIKTAADKNAEAIKAAAEKFAEVIESDRIIHVFGTGHSHMIGIELFARAGGLGNVNAILDPDCLTNFGAQRSCAMERLGGVADIIYDNYHIRRGDIMVIISNSGRNAMPIEMAMRCKSEGIYVIAVTNLYQSENAVSRHPSGKKMYEYADLILDTCVPVGDAMLDIDGIKTGPASSVSSMCLLDTVFTEAIKIVVSHGSRPYVFQSQNLDGVSNDEIFKKYEGYCKHF